jgi:hypothetical protein
MQERTDLPQLQPSRCGLSVATILLSGLEQAISTDPSNVQNRTIRATVVSTMLIGAMAYVVAALRINSWHCSKDMDCVRVSSSAAAAVAGAPMRAAHATTTSFGAVLVVAMIQQAPVAGFVVQIRNLTANFFRKAVPRRPDAAAVRKGLEMGLQSKVVLDLPCQRFDR